MTKAKMFNVCHLFYRLCHGGQHQKNVLFHPLYQHNHDSVGFCRRLFSDRYYSNYKQRENFLIPGRYINREDRILTQNLRLKINSVLTY